MLLLRGRGVFPGNLSVSGFLKKSKSAKRLSQNWSGILHSWINLKTSHAFFGKDRTSYGQKQYSEIFVALTNHGSVLKMAPICSNNGIPNEK